METTTTAPQALDWRDLSFNGDAAKLRAFGLVQAQIAELAERLAALERQIAAHTTPIPSGGGTVTEVWCGPDGLVEHSTQAVELRYIHSPGYPADEGEYAGGDALTDTGLTYREVDALLHPGEWG